MKRILLLGSALALALMSCTGTIGEDDAGALDAGARPDAGETGDASVQEDSGIPDAGSLSQEDAGTDDAGVTDAGPADAGPQDAGAIVDAGEQDAGPADAGVTTDAGRTDAGTADAGRSDAGRMDAGTSDAGRIDAGSPADAGINADAGLTVNIPGVGPLLSPLGGYEATPTNPWGGTDYFVDSRTGSDGAAGTTMGAPWKTLAKVQSFAFQPGDRVFLARGSLFRESLTWTRTGNSTKPVLLSAWGSGPAPVISGSTAVTGWSLHAGNIYKATLTSPPANVDDLSWNGSRQTRARFPNADATNPFLFKDVYTTTHPQEAMGVRYLKDAELPAAPGGSYAGASIVTRTASWAYLPAGVTSHDVANKVLSIDFRKYSQYLNPSGEWPLYQWGYFFYDKLEFLDQPGEWHYDSGSHTLYFQAPGNVSPASGSVELPTRANGIYVGSNVQYLTIENLEILGTTGPTIQLDSPTEHVTLSHLELHHSLRAISGWGDRNAFVDHNLIHDIWEEAIELAGSDGLNLSYNRVERVALIPGRAPNDWTYIAVDVQRISTGTLAMHVHHNEIFNTGYIALILAGPGLAEFNLIDSPMLMLNDGGGFGPEHVAWNEQVTFRRNILRNCSGNIASVAPDYHHYYPMCFGIYWGDHSPANGIVEENTVIGTTGAGTLVDSSRILNGSGMLVPVMGQVLRNNIFYGCKTGILLTDQSLFWANYVATSCDPRLNSPCFVPLVDKLVQGNTVYSTSADQIGMRLHYVYADGMGHSTTFGTSNNNNLFQPFTPSLTVVRHFDNGTTPLFNGTATAIHNMTLAQWQAQSGNDLNSRVSSPGSAVLAPAATRGRLICNDTFASKTFSSAAGTLERCLYDLSGTALPDPLTLAPMECRVAEKAVGTGC